METKKKLLYEELTYDVLGCAYNAFKIVGVGFDEVRYHKIFHEYLVEKGLNAKYKEQFYIEFSGERLMQFEIDEIVEDKLIIELKCIQTDFIPENYAQILSYLKMKNLKLGFLINFGLNKAYPKRVIFEEKRIKDIEKWDQGFFNNLSVKKNLDTIVGIIHKINNSLGAAYHNKIYQAAFRLELKHNQINYDDNMVIDTNIGNIKFNPFKIDYWLIEKALLVGIIAGKDKPRLYDLLRMKTYLRKLKLKHGLIAFWSNKNLQLYGIHEQ